MAHKIFGRILDEVTGLPVSGAYIQAWDSDTFNEDDFMGSAFSNADGRYCIDYRNKEWDEKIPGLTTFRPDIYLFIQRPNIFNQLINAKTTSVKSNWKMSNDLEWNTSIPNRDYSRTVRGTIQWKPPHLTPAVGVEVRAYECDQDDGSGALNIPIKMGEAITDDNGWYVIGYDASILTADADSPLNNTSWRPDIAIEVWQKGVYLGHSKIHWDVKYVEGVVINLSVDRVIQIVPAGNG